MSHGSALTETVTLTEAKGLITALAAERSILLLSPPGVGKSDTVARAATEAGLSCTSLLGTQIAPEDVSGVPRIVGERSVFCPPRVLLPEDPKPFCLFLDELPACAPDIQKAFYSLLLERRLGEHRLPKGTWVVAAGNRAEDRALVRSLSSALVNRVVILNVRVDVREWLTWAKSASVRPDVRAFIACMPDSLMRPVPRDPVPFSTPRAWASLAHALDLADAAGLTSPSIRRALAFGSVSAEDAAVFCAMAEDEIPDILPVEDYVRDPGKLRDLNDTARWFVLNRVRDAAARGRLKPLAGEPVRSFLRSLPEEHRCALLIDLVGPWADLGAGDILLSTLAEVTGV